MTTKEEVYKLVVRWINYLSEDPDEIKKSRAKLMTEELLEIIERK